MLKRKMLSHDRYTDYTPELYAKHGIMTYLCRRPSDKKLIPEISRIKGKSILDVGLGTGDYTRLLLANNKVVGVDQNPHLCRLPITVHKGDATELSSLVGQEKFDIVLSTWTTDYLNRGKLQQFFCESKKVLKDGGKLMTTVIRLNGWGLIYLFLARFVRGVDKHACSTRGVIKMLRKAGFNEIDIVNLNSWLGVPWAYLVIAE
jgi:ubiquinone/menaquinone biosynthesis C-methylase UbiE